MARTYKYYTNPSYTREKGQAMTRGTARGLASTYGMNDAWQAFFYSTIEAESNFDPNAVSRTGAFGMGQMFLPAVKDAAKMVGETAPKEVPSDPLMNLRYSGLYNILLYKQFEAKKDTFGNPIYRSQEELFRATAVAYNQGRTKVSTKGADAVLRHSGEARGYVNAIFTNPVFQEALAAENLPEPDIGYASDPNDVSEVIYSTHNPVGPSKSEMKAVPQQKKVPQYLPAEKIETAPLEPPKKTEKDKIFATSPVPSTPITGSSYKPEVRGSDPLNPSELMFLNELMNRQKQGNL